MSLSAQHQQWYRPCKNFIFLLQNVFEKNLTSLSDALRHSFFCLVIRHQYHFHTTTHFSTICYLSIQRRPLVFQANKCLNFQKHPIISVSEKFATQNIFGNFPVKHPCWNIFKVHLRDSQKAVLNSYSIENLHAAASVKRNFTAHNNLKNFQESQKHARLKTVISRPEIF